MPGDDYNPWTGSYMPHAGEMVRFLGDGVPVLARVVTVETWRTRGPNLLLVFVNGDRRRVWASMVRRLPVPSQRSRAVANPRRRGRKPDPNSARGQARARRQAELLNVQQAHPLEG